MEWDTLTTHKSWHESKSTESATMSIWLESFYDMSILKWIALRAMWHKTAEKLREVLSQWCHYLQWTGNLTLPHFYPQMDLSSLSGSQSTIFESPKYWHKVYKNSTITLFLWNTRNRILFDRNLKIAFNQIYVLISFKTKI